MPELPEVEVVRAGLERHVVGARVVAVGSALEDNAQIDLLTDLFAAR